MTRAVIALSGGVFLVVGIMVLVQPSGFTSAPTIGGSASLMSELRAPGGLLLVAGGFVLWAGLRAQRFHSALALSALLYGTFGLSRLLSVALDGVPSSAILGAAAIELALGGVALGILRREREEGREEDRPEHGAVDLLHRLDPARRLRAHEQRADRMVDSTVGNPVSIA